MNKNYEVVALELDPKDDNDSRKETMQIALTGDTPFKGLKIEIYDFRLTEPDEAHPNNLEFKYQNSYIPDDLLEKEFTDEEGVELENLIKSIVRDMFEDFLKRLQEKENKE